MCLVVVRIKKKFLVFKIFEFKRKGDRDFVLTSYIQLKNNLRTRGGLTQLQESNSHLSQLSASVEADT